MAKVLIIDSNDERRKSLTARLRHQGMVVSAMSMISLINIQNIITGNDILVLLDQEDMTARASFNCLSGNQLKILLNNNHVSGEIDCGENIIFLNDEDIEAAVMRHIELVCCRNPGVQVIAEDPRSKAILEIARKAAKTNVTVLITGETGTGKEVLAHYIHQYSAVARGPFVSVNCAALPENMMEAILFGYEKGAFTSAISHYAGKFEQAQNGTLLLDEISEIPVGLQAKLLRVLQEREIERLGGKKIIKVNVRIIAATNRDLCQQIKAGAFREDLFYRLNVMPLHCAALRDRPLDILPLAEHLIQHHSALLGCNPLKLTVAAKAKLMNYRWPGNIREMDNVIQRTLIMTESGTIDAGDIDINDNISDITNRQNIVDIGQFDSQLEASEAKVIIDVLNETDGCRNVAARKLNISPRTLRYKIAKLRAIGLKVP